MQQAGRRGKIPVEPVPEPESVSPSSLPAIPLVANKNYLRDLKVSEREAEERVNQEKKNNKTQFCSELIYYQDFLRKNIIDEIKVMIQITKK